MNDPFGVVYDVPVKPRVRLMYIEKDNTPRLVLVPESADHRADS